MEKTSDQPTGKLPDSKALQQRITPKQLRQKSTNEPWIMTCPKPLIYISTPLPSTKPPTSFIPTEATCSSALCFTIAFWKNWRSSVELYSFSFSKVAAYDSQYRKDIWRSNPNGCHLLLKAGITTHIQQLWNLQKPTFFQELAGFLLYALNKL